MAAKKKSAKATKSNGKISKSPITKTLTKSQIVGEIAMQLDGGITKKDVSAIMFEALPLLIKRSIGKNGVGIFVLPGIAKFKVVRKPATKAREGINPFTKQPTVFKARPARNVIKIRPLSGLKEMVS